MITLSTGQNHDLIFQQQRFIVHLSGTLIHLVAVEYYPRDSHSFPRAKERCDYALYTHGLGIVE